MIGIGIGIGPSSGSRGAHSWDGVLDYVWIADQSSVLDTAGTGHTPVATWNPSTGAVPWAQSTGAAQPAWASTGWGTVTPAGLVVPSGSGPYLTANALAAVAQSAFTIITAFVEGTTATRYLWGWGNTASATNFMRHYTSGTASVFGRSGTGSGTLTATSVPITAGGTFVESFAYNGTSVIHRVNGTATNISGSAIAGTGLSLNTFSLSTYVSNTGPNTNWGDQKFRFVGLALRALSVPEIAAIDSELLASAA